MPGRIKRQDSRNAFVLLFRSLEFTERFLVKKEQKKKTNPTKYWTNV